jgi:hypothetical protein
MLSHRLCHGLPDFGATVGAFVDEVDPGHAPMGFDVPDIHRKQSYAAGANHRGSGFCVVMLDVGWHFGSPSQRKHGKSQPRASLLLMMARSCINSFERTRNNRIILVRVAFL